MMNPKKVLVSDTSILIDLERGALLESCFRLPFQFSVPDILYERELKNHGGDELLKLGLRIEELDGTGVACALGYRRREPLLSLPDTFALALAARNTWTLLTGDRALRELAIEEHVDCHGVLWLLDQMFDASAATASMLCSGLKAIRAHPRCRLPKSKIRKRISRYSASGSN